MTMPEILTQTTLGIIGVLLTGLGVFLTYLIHKYIKSNELKLILTSLTVVVENCVKEVYQTYVEELKDKNMFDEKAQKKALKMCLDKIQSIIPKNIEAWLDKNFTNIKEYLITLIESSIATLKASGK